MIRLYLLLSYFCFSLSIAYSATLPKNTKNYEYIAQLCQFEINRKDNTQELHNVTVIKIIPAWIENRKVYGDFAIAKLNGVSERYILIWAYPKSGVFLIIPDDLRTQMLLSPFQLSSEKLLEAYKNNKSRYFSDYTTIFRYVNEYKISEKDLYVVECNLQ